VSNIPIKKDVQSVSSNGTRIAPLIDGIVIRSAITHSDERGTVSEIYSLSWGVHPNPIVHIYQVSIRPGKVKGWALHYKHDDRLYLLQGTVKFVFYDEREESPTCKMLNEVVISDYHRSLIIIPRGVFHALQNIGNNDAILVSVPTEAYDYEDPDVYRLPVDTDLIPYKFEQKIGW
jgi:dTDP-4-dehydrorhamnose 3,5-epimerase